MQQHHAWPGLKSLVMVESVRELGEKIEQGTRYYLSSLILPAEQQGSMVRDHWAAGEQPALGAGYGFSRR